MQQSGTVSMTADPLFRSPFAAGFECSSHRRADGRRVDCLASTAHDRLYAADYDAVARHGLRTVRDGFRWHLVETKAYRYDWTSVRPMLKAARSSGLQVIWDLCHYGWPDGLDIWSPAFIERFARYAGAAAAMVSEESGEAPFVCPINEMSYFAWAGSDGGLMNPLAPGRGDALKRRLVEATVAAIDAVRAVAPEARVLHAEPCVNIVAGSPDSAEAAKGWHLAQYEALDMLAGRLVPEVGGAEYLDVVGVNYYPDNQWIHEGSTVPLGLHTYRPFRDMLAEVHSRYGRPMMVSETGAEGSGRAAWLHYVCGEVDAARAAGVPVEAVCLYPILDYPGWSNDRPCEVGLFAQPDAHGRRAVHEDLAAELRRQQGALRRAASSRGTSTTAGG